MDHYINIYSNHADIYHRMIAAEDVDGNLLPALKNAIPIKDKCVLDLGSGSGRIPLLLHEQAHQIAALDLHRGMLLEQQRQRDQRLGNWGLLQGDLRVLPFPKNHFDIVTAGWAIGHFQSWHTKDWQNQVDRAIHDMLRVVKPDGALIIIETLTTGSTTPAPPTKRLAEYYDRLEMKWGFECQEITTDYQFQNLEEAVELADFFFGNELAQKVRENNWVRLPEWTGVWSISATLSKTVSATHKGG
jgi:ubiquinone/menaquinone biosynthesis C-methylase UbiE